MLDLLVKDAQLSDGSITDVGVRGGTIEVMQPHIDGEALEVLDAKRHLLTAPFVDSHFHMDSTLTVGQPRYNQSGTLLEGIQIWDELKPSLDADELKKRALKLCHWSIARGTLAIRSHVDVSDDSLMAVDVLLEVKEAVSPWLDLQLVAFPQNGYLRQASCRQNLNRALEKGVDVVGGIPHFERTMNDGAESIKLLCEIAERRGLRVDMHCDESDDPMSRHVETLAFHATRLGLNERVAGSHLTSMHSMDNYYVSKLLPLMVEAQMHAVANPLINITLQGRSDTYPKRRGMTRVKELMAAGVNVSMGHDCVMDPWYGLGSHDMLEVAHMGVHVGQLTGRAELGQAFDAVTVNAANVLGLEGYGLAPGCNADFVLLQANDPADAIRLRATRLAVVRRGKVIAKSAPQMSTVMLDSESVDVDFLMR